MITQQCSTYCGVKTSPQQCSRHCSVKTSALLQVYFIVELAELSKLKSKHGSDRYRRELKATLELANAVGRKVLGTGPNTLTRGCVLRLQQLLDKGYLAVKRPKGSKQEYKPAPYPGDSFSLTGFSLTAIQSAVQSDCSPRFGQDPMTRAHWLRPIS